MAKDLDQSTPAASGNIHYAEVKFAGEGGLTASKPLLAEGEVSKPALREKLRFHLERAQDANEFLGYLDQVQPQAQFEPSAAAPPTTIDSKPSIAIRPPGRPDIMSPIEVEAERRIREGEVVPRPKGFSQFARDLWQWWEKVREDRKALKSWRSITSNKSLRQIWNTALRLHKTK